MFSVEEIQSLNELELAVYEYVMQHKSAISYMRIRELAAEAHVSTTTVLRFCKKMGCDGYAEFKLRMKEYNGLKKIVMLSEDMSEIRAFFERLETDKLQQKLEEAAAMIAKTERVIFVGIGSSGHVGQYAARCFTNLGKFSLYISDPFNPINMKCGIYGCNYFIGIRRIGAGGKDRERPEAFQLPYHQHYEYRTVYDQ